MKPWMKTKGTRIILVFTIFSHVSPPILWFFFLRFSLCRRLKAQEAISNSNRSFFIHKSRKSKPVCKIGDFWLEWMIRLPKVKWWLWGILNLLLGLTFEGNIRNVSFQSGSIRKVIESRFFKVRSIDNPSLRQSSMIPSADTYFYSEYFASIASRFKSEATSNTNKISLEFQTDSAKSKVKVHGTSTDRDAFNGEEEEEEADNSEPNYLQNMTSPYNR